VGVGVGVWVSVILQKLGNPCTVDLLIKIAYFVNNEKKIFINKSSCLELVVQGGQLF
jgi:hypothetical protein